MRTRRCVLSFGSVAVILAAFLIIPLIQALAQDDESPEQKKLLQTLEEREMIAEEVHRAEPMGDLPDGPYDEDLMRAKENDRASEMRNEQWGNEIW